MCQEKLTTLSLLGLEETPIVTDSHLEQRKFPKPVTLTWNRKGCFLPKPCLEHGHVPSD